MRAERFSHHVGAAGAQPVLKQALRQQVRRDHDAPSAPSAQRSHRIGHPRRPSGGERQLNPRTGDRRQPVAIVCRSRCAAGSDVPAAARITESSRRQPASISRSAKYPHQLGPRPERFRHGDIGMSACLYVGGDIGGDVIAAGEKRRHHDRWPGPSTRELRTGSGPARRRTTRAPSAQASQTPAAPDRRPSPHPAACGCHAPPTPNS